MSQQPTKEVFTLARFVFGDPINPDILALTDANQTLTTAKGIFRPDPVLRVHPVEIYGTLDEPIRKVDFSDQTFNFANSITSGEAFPPVDVDVWEYVRQTGGDIYYHVFSGVVQRAVRNPKGRENIFQLKVAGEKLLLQGKKSGLPMLELCDNTFGDADTCKVDLVPITEIGLLTTIDKQVVTITGLATHTKGYWVKGFVDHYGTRVRIIDWDLADDFTLARIPPENYLNGNVSVVPGCDNALAVCKGRWQNEANFLGPGIAMPDHHPVFENPRGT